MNTKHLVYLIFITLCLFRPYSSFSQLYLDSLIAYYPFDGDVLDHSSNSYHGIQNGGVFVQDESGANTSALRLNGFNDFVDISSFARRFRQSQSEFSIYFKIKFEKFQDNQDVLSLSEVGDVFSNNVIEIEMEQGVFQFETETGNNAINHELRLDSQSSFFDNEWHEVLITLNGDSLTYCRDGNVEYEGLYIPAETSCNSFFVGCYSGNEALSCCFFGGIIDELQFYNRVVDHCSEICEPDFRWSVSDTIICEGDSALFKLSSPDDSLFFEGQLVKNDFQLLLSPLSRWCYNVKVASKLKCDTSFQVCIDIREKINLINREINHICQGDEARLDLITDADSIVLMNTNSRYILENIQVNNVISNPVSDSCYLLSLFSETKCDLISDYCIEVHENFRDSSSYSYCYGDTLFINGGFVSSDTTICTTYLSRFNCDSTVCNDYSFDEVSETKERIPLCEGEVILVFGEEVFESGDYQRNFIRPGFCDSIHFVEVYDVVAPSRDIDIDLCQGKSLSIYGTTLSESGVYVFHVDNSSSCDSINTINLSVHDTFNFEFNYDLCFGDSLWIVDAYEQVSGEYLHILSTEKGCDSILNTRINAFGNTEGPSLEINCDDASILAMQVVPENWSVIWSNGDTLNSTSYNQGGTEEEVVLVRLINNNSDICEQEFVFSLPVIPDSSSFDSIQRDTQLIFGESITIVLPFDENDWYVNWSSRDIKVQFDCDSCNTITLNLIESTSISYTIIHLESGCEFTFKFEIELIDSPDIFIPNAFSPNEDGNNDFWELYLTDRVEQVISCSVYNRWGDFVFESNNTREVKWDGSFLGRSLNTGVFAYYVEYKLKNGVVKVCKGDITIVK